MLTHTKNVHKGLMYKVFIYENYNFQVDWIFSFANQYIQYIPH